MTCLSPLSHPLTSSHERIESKCCNSMLKDENHHARDAGERGPKSFLPLVFRSAACSIKTHQTLLLACLSSTGRRGRDTAEAAAAATADEPAAMELRASIANRASIQSESFQLFSFPFSLTSFDHLNWRVPPPQFFFLPHSSRGLDKKKHSRRKNAVVKENNNNLQVYTL